MGRSIIALAIIAMLTSYQAQATNRWDIIKWCSATLPEEMGRCEGFLRAAIDLRTKDEFTEDKSCFLPSTRLHHVREEVVLWLQENTIVEEQSGLALVNRAIKERYPCPHR